MRGFAGTVVASLCLLAASAGAMPASQLPQTIPEGEGSSGSSLSRHLDRSGGVIHPPAGIDPAITQPPPAAGSHRMPIVPPPGTPGGDPNIKPK